MTFKTRTIKPLNLKQNRLPLQFSIVVPATEKEKEISPQRFALRTIKEKKYLDNLFGGDTSVIGKGSSPITNSKGIAVKESVAIVESSTTPKVFENRRKKIMQHIQDRQKRWKQDTIFYKIEGESFIYPKKKFIANDISKKEISVS